MYLIFEIVVVWGMCFVFVVVVFKFVDGWMYFFYKMKGLNDWLVFCWFKFSNFDNVEFGVFG